MKNDNYMVNPSAGLAQIRDMKRHSMQLKTKSPNERRGVRISSIESSKVDSRSNRKPDKLIITPPNQNTDLIKGMTLKEPDDKVSNRSKGSKRNTN